MPALLRTSSTIALAAAMALQSVVYSQTASTRPAKDWSDQINDALSGTGSLNALRKQISSFPPSEVTIEALVRISLEDGELTRALGHLEKLAEFRSNDASVLLQLARLQELVGQTEHSETTLATAVRMMPDGTAKSDAILRLAALQFDAGRADDAIKLLKNESGPSMANRAGIISYFYAHYADSAEFFTGAETHDVGNCLLQGNSALMAGNTALAAKAFEAAEKSTDRSFDRSYIIERTIATARKQGTLSQLADRWLADSTLPIEKALPLATMLRELNRVSELLAWWRIAATKPDFAETVLSDRFVNEVLGAARSAGFTEQALTLCVDQLEREPTSWQWLTAALRANLSLGRGEAADGLLQERLRRVAESPELIRRLGRLARDLGRSRVALEASDYLVKTGGLNSVQGCLLAASIHDHDGNPAESKKSLADAAALAQNELAAVNDVAAALEGAGQDQQAIALLKEASGKQTDDAFETRLASLLIKNKRSAEAIPLLERIMRAPGSAALRSQAAQRLLEAAAATRSTNELIVRTRARLENGDGDAQDLTLLVDGLLSQKQFDAAVMAIRTSGLLDKPTQLRRLSVLFLRNDRLDDAEKALRELANIDPDSFNEAHERLASIAIKRGKPDDATAAIAAISGRNQDADESIDRMAGVLNRLGRAADAAVLYRRLIARQPTNADNWLLWSTSMQKSGKAAVARRRLMVLCGETPSDNVFAAAGDALLNLNAPPEMLRVLRREALIRLSQRPDKIMLNHVLADLSEELSDPRAMVRATELGIAVSDEERSQRLRLLMDTAAQNGLLDTAVDCGRSLLALGDDFPPQLFLQLAERLLIAGRPEEAVGAFARASESADPDFVALQSGAMLEKFDFPAEAFAALKALRERRAADFAFQLHLADLAETIGQLPTANSIRTATAVRLMREDVQQTPEMFTSLGRAFLGSLRTASPELKGDILASAEQYARSLIENSVNEDVPPTALLGLAKQFRQAASLVNRIERADEVDDLILAKWPTAHVAFQDLIEQRIAAGQVQSALKLAQRHNAPLPPNLARYAETLHAPATRPASMTVRQAADAIVLPMVKGDYDAAREILAHLEIDEEATDRKKTVPGLLSPFRTLVIAANLLGEEAKASTLALTWADTFEKPVLATQPAATRPSSQPVQLASSSTLPNFYLALVNSSWRYFPRDARVGLIKQIQDRLAGVVDPRTRGTLSLYILQLSADVGLRLSDAVELGTAAVASQPFSLGEVVAKTFAAMPAADRAEFLRALCKSVPANRQLAALLAVVAKSDTPLDAGTRSALVGLVNDLPTGQAIDWSDWFVQNRDAGLLKALAEAAERTLAESPPGDMAHAGNRAALAAAWANAGEVDKADTTAVAALTSLSAYAAPSVDSPRAAARPAGLQTDRVTALRVAIMSMSTTAKQSTLAKLQNGRAWTTADETWRSIQQIILLNALGRRDESLATLRKALAIDPSDQQLIVLYKDRLKEDGRDDELARLTPRLSGTGFIPNVLRQDVTAALRNLYRWREIPNEDGQDKAKTFDLMSAVASGDSSRLSVLFRSILITVSNGNGMPPVIYMPSAGGLESQAPPQRSQPPIALNDFVNWPGMTAAALETLHSPTTVGPAAEWLATLITRVAKTDAALRRQLLDSLRQANAADTLSSGERMAIGLLAKVPEINLPAELVDALRPMAIIEPGSANMTRWAEALATRQGSVAARKWAEVSDYGGRQISTSAFVEVMPFDALDDGRVSASLNALAAKDNQAASRQFEMLRDAGRLQPRMIATRLVGLRLQAERGKWAAYEKELNSILHDWAWQSVVGRAPGGTASANFDITLALPGTAKAEVAAGIVQRCLKSAAAEWPGETDLTRAFALAGAWAFDSHSLDAAESFLRMAQSLSEAQGVGQHQLWVANLLRRMGHTIPADAIDKRLLAERCLPAFRVHSVIERSRTTNASAAEQLRNQAATYIADPRLIEK